MSGWSSPYDLLVTEFTQRSDEGCRIPASLHQRLAELHPEHDRWDTARIDPLYDDLMALAGDDALAGQEPNDLAAIRALRPSGPRELDWKPSPEELVDRLHGAFLGRFSGCALGKPVEGMGMYRDARERGRARIKRYLTNRGDWPLQDYFSGREVGDGLTLSCPDSTRERIAFMEADDDVHYTLVGLAVIEDRGPEFTWRDIAEFWKHRIPYGAICTAETQAILTYLRNTCTWPALTRATPALTRRHRNPFREWIGAQIRSDGWAYTCAGKPELAAEFAWRDAHWTHERNGIYGEMFCAAMQAAAFVESDPRRLIAMGLSEIPARCRLALAVEELLSWIPECPTWESCMDRLDARWADMSPVHTINNALICTMALIYGRMDTVQVPVISVMAGLDTDCNGATVGSIVGAAAGRSRFNDRLSGRLNDEVRPSLIGFTQSSITDLARRAATAWNTVETWHRQRQTGSR